MSLISRSLLTAGLLATVVASSSACSQDNGETTVGVPPRAGFSAVSAVLEPRCGTLDCHGGPARNLRIYGLYGLRASGADVTGGADTTPAEIEQTYRSLVSVQPEILAQVYAQGGFQPERWIVLSKGRGREQHEGGERVTENTPADLCIVTWLSGAVDTDTCVSDTFGPVPREGETW